MKCVVARSPACTGMDWFASFRGHRAFWLPKMTREVVVLSNAVLLVGCGVWGFSGVGGIGGSQFIFFGKLSLHSVLLVQLR